MEFTGKIIFIGKEEKVGKNELLKVTFVMEESEAQYPNSMAIDLFGDKTELIKSYKVGDTIKAGLNFRSREYNDRYFNSISAWRIDPAEEGASNAPAASTGDESADDDLPF